MLLRHNFKSAKTQFPGKCKENMRQILFISLMRDSKLGKEYIKAVYCHPAYLTYMQSTSWEMQGCMKQAGIKIAGRNISNLRYADTTLMTESEEELKSFLVKVKEESKKLA